MQGIQEAIAHLQKKLRDEEEHVAKTKQAINMLCESASLPPLYSVTEADAESVFSLRTDQFYGRPLATVMKEYLKMRRNANMGPATVVEIYDALRRGGYRFDAKNDDNAKRGLQIGLSKNQIFHRVPSGGWGLAEWYQNIKPPEKEKSARKPNRRRRRVVTKPTGSLKRAEIETTEQTKEVSRNAKHKT